MPSLETLFLALAIFFLGLVSYDYLKEQTALTPARKTWLLLAMIFTLVALLQFVMHRLL